MAAPPNYRALLALAGVPYFEAATPNGQPWQLFLRFQNIDYTGAAIAVDLRSVPDLALSGVALTVGTKTLDGADTLCTATLSKVQNEAYGSAADIGREIELYGRVIVTPAGLDPRLWAGFKLTRLGS